MLFTIYVVINADAGTHLASATFAARWRRPNGLKRALAADFSSIDFYGHVTEFKLT